MHKKHKIEYEPVPLLNISGYDTGNPSPKKIPAATLSKILFKQI